QANVKDQMLSWALLLDHQFAAAKTPLGRLYEMTGNSSTEAIAPLLAWCDVETGDFQAAGPLLQFMPVPPVTGIGTFMPMWFPRIVELRAMVAEKTGNAAEATKDRELARKFSTE